MHLNKLICAPAIHLTVKFVAEDANWDMNIEHNWAIIDIE